LGAALQPVRERYVSAVGVVAELSFEQQVLTGSITGEDSLFDPILSLINDHLLLGVGKNRDSEVYRSFYPSGRLQESTRAPSIEDPKIAERIAAAAKAHPNMVPDSQVTELVEVGARIAELISKAEANASALANANLALELATIPLVRLYNENFHQLRLLFPEREAFVESFYLRTAKSTKQDDEA
jgi:hypothetical protein